MRALAKTVVAALAIASCGGTTGGAPSPAAASAEPSATAAATPVTVKFGQVGSVSDAAIFIADAKGYFKEQAITLEAVPFTSAALMVAPLGTNEIQAGGGAPSAGLYNAVDRGVRLRIVADKGSLTPGHGYEVVIVRKALADKVKSAKDLRGLKISIAARDIVPEYSLDQYLRTGGLTIKDVEVVPLAFPDMIPALASGAIDVAIPTEPTATRILDAGTGVLLTRTESVVPGEQTAVILYSEKFAQDKDAATRFMVAYLKGARYFNDAFDKGDATKKQDVIDIVAKGTKLDPALLARVIFPGIDPNGKLSVDSLNAAQQYFVMKGSQTKAIDLTGIVDSSFADEAVKRLGGPYK
jgi:NitT/TauT family transport system substrate-binding protein